MTQLFREIPDSDPSRFVVQVAILPNEIQERIDAIEAAKKKGQVFEEETNYCIDSPVELHHFSSNGVETIVHEIRTPDGKKPLMAVTIEAA